MVQDQCKINILWLNRLNKGYHKYSYVHFIAWHKPKLTTRAGWKLKFTTKMMTSSFQMCSICRNHNPYSWHITWFVTSVTRLVPRAEQEVITLPEFTSDFRGAHVAPFLVFCIMFCRLLSFCPFSFGLCVVCLFSIWFTASDYPFGIFKLSIYQRIFSQFVPILLQFFYAFHVFLGIHKFINFPISISKISFMTCDHVPHFIPALSWAVL
jgi:hypothetical protein